MRTYIHSLFTQFWRGCLLVILIGLISACHKHDDEPEVVYANSTLLVYICGDNSLSSYASKNIQLCTKGVETSDKPVNIVIMCDDKSTAPQLIYLKKDKNNIVTQEVLKVYDEQNVLDKDFMSSVINETFTRYNTPIKGIVLWSHAHSWIPSPNFVLSASESNAADRPQLSYFGQDDNKYMEIWDLKEVLSRGPHLDFIIADACHLATAEVAYEFRNTADYLLASPSEMLGDGMPYAKLVPIVASTTQSNIESSLTSIGQAYMKLYPTAASMSLIRLMKMDAVATQYRVILHANKELRKQWAADPSSAERELQRYGRAKVSARYYYYDINSVAKALGEPSLTTTLSTVIPYYDHAESFTIGDGDVFYYKDCSGLAVSVPEFFDLVYSNGQSEAAKLKAAYPLTEWGAFMAAAD